MERHIGKNFLASYAEIYKAFDKTPAAESLKNIYRWSTGGFRTDESNEIWRKALGPTAIDFEHGFLMVDLGYALLEKEKGRFTEQQEDKFLSGLMLHDWGEPILPNTDSVGDVNAQIKTSEDEKKESVIARIVINSLDVNDSTKKYLTDAYHDVVEGGDPELYNFFKAVEKSEYIFTVMHVYIYGKTERENGRQGIENDKPFIGRVLTIDLPKVIDIYAKDYPDSIGARFKRDAKLIDEMFAYALPWLKANDMWQGKAALTRKDKDGKDEFLTHKQLADEFKVKWSAFKNRD